MPKSKKQKTAHNRDNRSLTHHEIWDDSALLRSWDEAVKEYELYHSIAAKGEDLDEVLRRAEMEESANGDGGAVHYGSDVNGSGQVRDEDEAEDGEVDENEDEGEVSSDEPTLGANGDGVEATAGPLGSVEAKAGPLGSVEAQAEPGPSSAPGRREYFIDEEEYTDIALKGSQDQTLENVKMAYWWAGYYSGLYEGQRQGAQR